MNISNRRILIVEDDLHLGFLLMDFLESEGFAVKLCRNGESGLSTFKKDHFDLCVLDVMLPEMDGFQLAHHLRLERKEIPFIFLTARSMKEDKLRGFTLGAEDFITKPFDEEVLLCRIKVIMRRFEDELLADNVPTYFSFGDYSFDYSRRELCYKGNSQRITEKESEVLRLLCLNQNQILKREEAVEKIYGKRDYFLGRSFDVFISRLRKLLSDDPRISIENVFKVGFIMNVHND
jgi:DNA-binding response OmpR family regulator